MNGYSERWVQSLRTECLEHFVICGENHLRLVLKEYLEHYNSEQPHQAKGKVPPPETDQDEPTVLLFQSSEVKCRKRLGGLLRHYDRGAACSVRSDISLSENGG